MSHLGVRLDPETQAALEQILPENPNRGDVSRLIRDLIRAEARRQQGEIWQGEGIWEGWELFNPGEDARHIVLVDPRGRSLLPGDIMEGFGKAAGAPSR